MIEAARQKQSEPYVWGRVLSRNPLVTISATTEGCPIGLMSVAGEDIGDQRALHLLHPTWSLEGQHAQRVASGISFVLWVRPKGKFIMMASNDLEVAALAEEGVPCIVGSGLLMTEERIWYPRQPRSSAARYEAVYVSRLDALKRHQLATSIENLMLIYGISLDPDSETSFERTRRLLPRATFANHDFHGGAYRMFTPDETAQLLALCNVGLCLSAVEGCMRASMEYLLCGLPVVSTRSVGGRDRYFGTSYCRVVLHDDPDAIAAAVRELAELNLDRNRIRQHVGEILAFERYNFLLAVNGLVRRHFGLDYDLFPTISPFLGVIAEFQPASKVRQSVVEWMQR